MKDKIITVIMAFACALVMISVTASMLLIPVQAEPPETRIIAWTNIRSTAANDTTPSAPKAWASKPTHSYTLYVKQTPDKIGQINTAILRFRFSGTGASANYYVWTRQYGDDAEFVCSGVATAGSQVATEGGKYAHSITVAADRSTSGAITTDSSGNNQMARLLIGTLRAEYIEVYFDGISAGTVYADIR